MNTQAQTVPADIFRRVTGLSIGLAVLMIVLGFAAMFKPFAAGVGISLFIAWIIVFSSVVHIVYAFAARSAGSFFWRMLIGVAYIVGGMYLLKNPSIALASLTLMLAVILIAEGVFQLITFFSFESCQVRAGFSVMQSSRRIDRISVARQFAMGHRHPGRSQPDNQWIHQIDVLRGGAKPD